MKEKDKGGRPTLLTSEALEKSEHYAAMVCDGSWPNYKGVEVECGGH